MNKKLAILGAGSFAKEIIWIIEEINRSCKNQNTGVFFDLVGLMDEDKNKDGLDVLGYKIYGELKPPSFWSLGNNNFMEIENNQKEKDMFHIFAVCSVGKAKERSSLVEKAKRLSYIFTNLIHPSTVISDNAAIGEGAVVMPGAIVAVDVELGSHVIVNKLCSIGHDSKIGDYCTLAPGVKVGGNVEIGEGCDIGMNASIIQSVRIGKGTTVGAGAVVLNNLPAGCTAVGVPAKIIK